MRLEISLLLVFLVYFSNLISIHVIMVDSFSFAIYKNELYANYRNQLTDRGLQTLWGIYQLILKYNDELPTIFATIDNIDDDHYFGADLAFWRPPNTNQSLLWPDHDYFGWSEAWLSPFPTYAKAMKKNMIPWEQRHHGVFWAGNPMTDLRKAYRKCSRNYSHDVVYVEVDWNKEREKSVRDSYLKNMAMKPSYLDSRIKQYYKFGVYIQGPFGWSSALKRMIASGQVLILPNPNPHETFVTELLSQYCSKCYLYYTNTKAGELLCHDLIGIVRRHNNHENRHLNERSRKMASDLIEFTEKYLGYDYTLQYMHETLTLLASKQNISYVENNMKKENMIKITCSHLFDQQRSIFHERQQSWQYDLWYDRKCNMILDAKYLNYMPL